MEIDAASNRGIDEIRNLRDKVRFAPQMCQYKIYIIDEVHMLTKEAFNALLKTLEEPPKHAIFILATTEPHKLPATIISRCQRFDFRKPSIEEIKKLVKKVAKGEGINIDDEAMALVAKAAEGSFRDALSLLEQVSSLGFRKLSGEKVSEALGLSFENEIFKFLKYFLKGDREVALEIVESLLTNGRDLAHFQNKLMGIFRQILLAKNGQEQKILPQFTPEQQKIILAGEAKFSNEKLLALIEDLSLSVGQIKYAALPSLPLESLIFKYLRDFEDEKQAIPAENLSQATQKEIDQETWHEILEKLQPYNHSLYGLMKSVSPANFSADKLALSVKFKFHADTLNKQKNKNIIEKVIKEVTGKDCQIFCQVDPSLATDSPSEDELISQALEVFEEN